MDNKTFGAKALEWQALTESVAQLAAELQAETVKRGKTQNFGDVRVTFSNIRKTYDYKAAVRGHELLNEKVLDLFTTQPPPPPPVTDWKGICKHVGVKVEGVVPEGKKPTAKIKIMK